jgi:hypothetical protein
MYLICDDKFRPGQWVRIVLPIGFQLYRGARVVILEPRQNHQTARGPVFGYKVKLEDLQEYFVVEQGEVEACE